MWLSIMEQYDRLNPLCAMLNNTLGNTTFVVLGNNSGTSLYYCYESIIYISKIRMDKF